MGRKSKIGETEAGRKITKQKFDREAREAANLVIKSLFYKAFREGELVWHYPRSERKKAVRVKSSFANYRRTKQKKPLENAEELTILNQISISLKETHESPLIRVALTRAILAPSQCVLDVLELLDNEEIGEVDIVDESGHERAMMRDAQLSK